VTALPRHQDYARHAPGSVVDVELHRPGPVQDGVPRWIVAGGLAVLFDLEIGPHRIAPRPQRLERPLRGDHPSLDLDEVSAVCARRARRGCSLDQPGEPVLARAHVRERSSDDRRHGGPDSALGSAHAARLAQTSGATASSGAERRPLGIDIWRMELTLRLTMRGEDKKQSSMLVLMSAAHHLWRHIGFWL
jgi:hypothetical protein